MWKRYLLCEACGRQFERQYEQDWECVHCQHDNKPAGEFGRSGLAKASTKSAELAAKKRLEKERTEAME